MTVDAMKEILAEEYNIRSAEDLEAAIESYSGLNIGLFTAPVERRKIDVKEQIPVSA